MFTAPLLMYRYAEVLVCRLDGFKNFRPWKAVSRLPRTAMLHKVARHADHAFVNGCALSSALDGMHAAVEALRKQTETLVAPLAATAATVSESKLFADIHKIVAWV